MAAATLAFALVEGLEAELSSVGAQVDEDEGCTSDCSPFLLLAGQEDVRGWVRVEEHDVRGDDEEGERECECGWE